MKKTSASAWKGLVIFLISMLGGLATAFGHADLKPHQVKAAYLYQISKFVFWPEELKKNADAFHLCQLGADSYDGMLQKMQGRKVFKKPIKVRQVSSLEMASTCHLLVISDPEKLKKKQLTDWLDTHSVLTVVDGNEHASKGMVAFVIEQQRVRLHINLGLAEQAKLSFAANLLEVASHIYRGAP